MASYSTVDAAQKSALIWLTNEASRKLRILLESKHLYQKVDFEPSQAMQAFHKEIVYQDRRNEFAEWANQKLPDIKFLVPNEPTTDLLELIGTIQGTAVPILQLHHPKLYCSTCDRREAFAPVWSIDFTAQTLKTKANNSVPPPLGFQLLLLVYKCQSCLGTPEGFLVRREGWTFSLQGRSPMEHVEVPTYIPKDERRFFRDALIAFNSGKTLAGIFYLRTFIEQFARRVTGKTGRATGEEILDAYYTGLPAPQKDQMPSLRLWYDKLSESLHTAVEDASLFEAAKSAIEEHFDMRRVFKITEKVQADKQPASTIIAVRDGLGSAVAIQSSFGESPS